MPPQTSRGRLQVIRFVTLFRPFAPLCLALSLLPAATGAARAEPVVIAAFGDSLSAGYQLPAEDAFYAQLERALAARGHDVRVIDASVSGDTTGAGRARLDWSIGDEVEIAIVELGANDALRGLPVEAARDNLDAIIARLKERGIKVLLAGMKAPRNMGEDYASGFDAIYPELAQKYDVALYPYFLAGIPVSADTVLPDGMHPTAKGVAIIVEGILPGLVKIVEEVAASRG
ncbi:arylesterase [Stappia sp.]|uniref:arylesterase n=1 Tax=Stappia sp. TaxID=1870903 RepID=UPI003A9A5447